MKIKWNRVAAKDYYDYQHKAKHIADKINELIASIKENPFSGIGKPEPLKYNLKGFWSRRITEEHRLIYTISGYPTENQTLYIYSCRGHYAN